MKALFRSIIIAVICVAVFAAMAHAGKTVSLYEKVTVGTGAAVALTSKPTGCSEALIICETNDIRFRRDGTAPTSTEGMLLEAGQNIVITGWTNINNFRAIAISATAYITVEYLTGY